jgi:peptide deformylase
MPDEWIRELGDPTLRTVAAAVSGSDGVVRTQLTRMARTLERAEGIGLAATQVGILRRAFVFRFSPEAPVQALVNPEIEAASEEMAEFVEGCLSFNSVVVAVSRPAAVRVRAQDAEGHIRTIEAEGIGASLLQHEIDHLDGILTLDRAAVGERQRALAALANA